MKACANKKYTRQKRAWISHCEKMKEEEAFDTGVHVR